MKLSSFHTKDDEVVTLNDFTVLVGANNVGKSQTLRDLHSTIREGRKGRTVIVSDVSTRFPGSVKDFLFGLTVLDDHKHADHKLYRGISSNLVSGEEIRIPSNMLDQQFDNRGNDGAKQWLLSQFGKYKVAYLDASTRLQIASAAPTHDPTQHAPQRLLQSLLDDEAAQLKLMEAFKDTFDMEVKLDYSMLAQLYLRVAREFPEIPEHPTRARPIMRKFGTLDEQGDGFRSFAGVLLSILLSKGRLLLIDEPEAFLHPAQARRLGYWVSHYAREAASQIVVATHNAHFLRGVLSADGEVDICRLNRNVNRTQFRIIGAESIENLSKSPLLSSQPVLESIFFRGVVVCEGDSDRLYYQTVATKEHDEHEVQFLHAHNKQTLKDVVTLLRAASIPCAAIADIDLLNSSTDLAALLASFGTTPMPDDIAAERAAIAAEVEGRSEDEIVRSLVEGLKEFLHQLEKGEHSLSGARSAIRRLDASSTRWSDLKNRGVAALEEPTRHQARQLLGRLEQFGVFVVPVGELESWVDVGTRRKRQWIVSALRELADYGAPDSVTDFVRRVISHASGEDANSAAGAIAG